MAALARSALAAAVLFATAARADIQDFIGSWENPSHDSSGLTHVVISPSGGSHVFVRAYGNCHPMECSWGLVQGKTYSNSPGSNAVDRVSAAFDFGFAHRQVIFRISGSGHLRFEMLTDYLDGSGRHDFASSGTLNASAWAGPVSQNWERPAALGTGWGGGPHGGAVAAPHETCVGFDPAAVHPVLHDGLWFVVGGAHTLVEAGKERRNAEDAASVIRHYRFDRKCWVGTNVYWKRGGSFPQHKMGGASCISFNPTTVHLAAIAHGWKIVDGVQWIASFTDRNNGEALLGLLRSRHLDTECFVDPPDPFMVYWLAHG